MAPPFWKKIEISPYLSNDLADRHEIGTVTHIDPLDPTNPKISTFW